MKRDKRAALTLTVLVVAILIIRHVTHKLHNYYF